MNAVALTEDAHSLWQAVLLHVREECNDYFGLTILDAVRFDGFSCGIAELYVPDTLRENWVNAHYGDILRKAFRAELGENFVDYKISVNEESCCIPTLNLTPVIPKIPQPKLKKPTYRAKLSLYPNYTFENFIEGECNSTACKACKAVAEKPGDPALNPLFVYGASGLGKTHLLQSIAAYMHANNKKMHIMYCHSYDFLRDATAVSKALKLKTGNVRELADLFKEKYENCDILLLDDVQLLEHASATQERLAILIKHLRSIGKQVVLSCDRHPSKFSKADDLSHAETSLVPKISAKLLAPLESCVAVGIEEPDLSTRLKLIRQKSGKIPFVDCDREEIFRFLSIRPQKNIRIIEGMLNSLSAMNQFCNEHLDLSAVKRLTTPEGSRNFDLTIKGISEVVAMEFSTDMVALSSRRQDAGVALPRKIAMYLCRELTKESHEKIGALFNRDYSSVIAAVLSLQKQMEKDEKLTRKVKDIRYLLESEL